MPRANKILGQANPSAGVLTALYTVPGSTEAIASSLSIANRSGTPTDARVAVAPAGAADDPSHYLYYDVEIPGNDTLIATVGLTLSATDVVRVRALDATLSFSLFGVELMP